MRHIDRRVLWGVLAAFLVATGGIWLAANSGIPQTTAEPSAARAPDRSSVSVPVVFEPNLGQAEPATLFLSRFSGNTAQFRTGEVIITPPTGAATEAAPARIALADANPAPTVRGGEQRTSVSNYYQGNIPDKWLTGVPHYEGVVYEQVYPGIDWVWYGNESRLEYDFRVAPGADPGLAKLRFSSGDVLRVDESGDLLINAEGQETRYLRPVVYQELAGDRRPVSGDYVLLAENRVGFALGAYDSSRELVIDPVVAYSSFYGTSADESHSSVIVDPAGNVYVVGRQGGDVVVFKLMASGTAVEYVTVVGGSSGEFPSCRGSALAVDEQGSVYFAGETVSADFPVTGGSYDTAFNGGIDIFVARLDPNGSLNYATFLGGSGDDDDACVALGPGNDVYVAAETDSINFPTTPGAFDRTFDAVVDVTVSKLRLAGQGANDLLYSTYIGGACNDRDPSLVVDDQGAAYVVAETGLPPTFPITPGAFDPTHNGEVDLAIFKLNPNGQGNQDLAYSTYFGGSGTEQRASNGKGIALDGAGNVYISGETDSENVPIPTTPGALDSSFNGEVDMFVAKLRLDGQGPNDLMFSTMIGGSGVDWNAAVFVDHAGLVYFAAESDSENVPFPTVNPIQPNYAGGGRDLLFGVLGPEGKQLLFSTYFGGSGWDARPDIFVDDKGSLTVVAETDSLNFPITPGAFDSTFGGIDDLTITRIEQLGIRMVTISNARPTRPDLAAETIVSGFGVGLAGQTLVATGPLPLPTELGGTSVRVIDSDGVTHTADLFFVSEFQINYLIPAGTALGWARVEVVRDGQIVARDGITVTTVSPGIYTANGTGSGAPAANFLLVKADNSRTSGPAFDGNAPLGQRMPVPLDMGVAGDGLYLTFFSTGTRGASTISATVDGVDVPALGPFALNEFKGLEQDNIGPLPRSLVGRGVVKVKFFFDGVAANEVDINLQ